MKETNNLYCIILAGGKGRRLWPCSRTEMPKQFIDFFGTGRTQLQQTYDRFRRFLPANHIFVSTNIRYRNIVAEQLPEIEACNILPEPIWRNTAPSIAWAAHRIYYFNNDASLIVAPSDQLIINDEAFCDDVLTGYEYVSENEVVLTMGVTPTRPEPGYGYLQAGDEEVHNIYKVQSFTEKPDRSFAQMFIDSGEFYWNTGLYMAKASHLLDCFRPILPHILRTIDVAADDFSVEDENNFIMESFSSYPNISMEKGVIDKADKVSVMKCHFGWADVGSWHGVYEAIDGDADENVVIDSDVILENSHRNIIKVPKGHLAVVNGLDGYIVVEKNDVLLICPREDSSALIRKYSTEAELRGV